jgi:hypothetical protein
MPVLHPSLTMSTSVPSTSKQLQYSASFLHQVHKSSNCALRRDVRKALFKHKLWMPKDIVDTSDKSGNIHGINWDNLREIPLIPKARKISEKELSVCSINAQSVRNKTLYLADYITENDYDIVAITETWLSAEADETAVGNLTSAGFTFKPLNIFHWKGWWCWLVAQIQFRTKSCI